MPFGEVASLPRGVSAPQAAILTIQTDVRGQPRFTRTITRAPVKGSSSHCDRSRALRLRIVRLDVETPHPRLEHYALLGHRERRAEAPPDPAAERNPLVGARLPPEPALRATKRCPSPAARSSLSHNRVRVNPALERQCPDYERRRRRRLLRDESDSEWVLVRGATADRKAA